MTRVLICIAIILAVVSGGAYYVVYQKDVAITGDASSPSAPPSGTVVVLERKNDEELTRKTLDGIGSVSKLKPVELGATLEHKASTSKH